jgi:uncharacterized damage-inducible protein DinB
VPPPELKADLHEYLRAARAALLWKLEGISEYDARRPLVATGTSLLGLVKHCATVEWGHFGAAFGQPFRLTLPWVGGDAEPDADMWAAPDESRAGLVALHREISAHSDTVIDELPLDAVGEVPWWPPESRRVTLQHILVHTVAEAQRHAGHADILRELVDGSAGYLEGTELLPDGDQRWWEQRRARLERIARATAQPPEPGRTR